MTLSIKDIRDSGLLELYVLGEASTDEQSIARVGLVNYPELIKDIQEIEYSLFQYAKIHAVIPSAAVKDNILRKISGTKKSASNKTSTTDTSGSKRSFLAPFLLSLLGALGILAALLYQNNKYDSTVADYEKDSVACDSLQLEIQSKDALYAAISDPNSRILPVNATENFAITNLYIHTNEDAEKNYMQVLGLPPLADNQSYQLWSLRDGKDPMPLDVFQGDGDNIFEIQYVENTAAYAITIEQFGGVESPTMERLIGVIPVT